MTKFYCPDCGKKFNLSANDKTLASFRRFWEQEHRQCAAYKAALELFDLFEPEHPSGWQPSLWEIQQALEKKLNG